MIITVDKTQDLRDRLKKEGKEIKFFDKEEDIKAIAKLDHIMEEVRRDYKQKDRESQVIAAQLTLLD